MRRLRIGDVEMPDGTEGRAVGVVVEWEDGAGNTKRQTFRPEELKTPKPKFGGGSNHVSNEPD
jgi:hypothetical protein